MKTEIAVFGGGCFWCTEAVFERVRGVLSVTSGYAGGTIANPSYDDVSSGRTGHAEVVKLEFDPTIISYEQLLEIFWHVHDPTSMNRQGADVGTQYASVIFTTSEAQQKKAEDSKEALGKAREFKDPIVTRIEPLKAFYTAEEYHKRYYDTHQDQPYCQLVIAPKVKKLLEKYGNLVK